MSLILLDTNVLIYLSKSLGSVIKQAEELRTFHHSFATSALCWAEFLNGERDHKVIDLMLLVIEERIIELNRESAELAARLFNAHNRPRSKWIDYMIAATALSNNAELWTANVSDFQSLKEDGLEVIPCRI